MELNIYSVRDELANRFLGMNMMMDDNEAKRMFKTQVNTLELWKHNSSDFSLYKLGTFNEETGEIWYKPEKLVGGRSVLDA